MDVVKRGVVMEVANPTNGFKYKVLLSDGRVEWVVSTVPVDLDTVVELTYMSTPSRGWYALRIV